MITAQLLQLTSWMQNLELHHDIPEVKFDILTIHHKYHISVDNGYLGCICYNREPEKGETHIRSSDLADGPLCYETWEKITYDIEATENLKTAGYEEG